MVKNNLKKYISGFSLIEVIIGLGIITVVLTSIILSLQFFIKASLLNTEKVQASFLLEEGIEIPRFLRDDSWSNITGLTVDTSYYFYFEGGLWKSTTTATTTNSFTRTVTFKDVYRKDSDDDIIDISEPDTKTLDSNIRMVTVSVSSPSGLSTKTLSTYITNLFNN